MTDAIQVAVRVRPLNKQEVEAGQSFAWAIQGNSIAALDARDTKYTLDHVFGPDWSTRQIYETVARGLLHKVISGFNSTVFAYGQTSSGKTFTMRGSGQEEGIIPLAVQEIFGLIEACQEREFLLRVSYMEVKHMISLISWGSQTSTPYNSPISVCLFDTN
jgi:centromeric protein E